MQATAACPKCGASRLPEALDCPVCGIVYAKYRGPESAAQPSAEPVTRSAPELPAYEEPRDPSDDFTEGVWRQGRDLVVSRLADLPDRCVRCNEPAAVRLNAKLHWHHAWIYLFLLLNILIYALVALCVRKTAALEVPLCGHHAKVRRYGILGAWGLVGVGCLAAWASAHWVVDAEGLLGALPLMIFFGAVLVALIGGFTIARPLVPRRMNDEFLWLRKCSKGFLASLPEAPAQL